MLNCKNVGLADGMLNCNDISSRFLVRTVAFVLFASILLILHCFSDDEVAATLQHIATAADVDLSQDATVYVARDTRYVLITFFLCHCDREGSVLWWGKSFCSWRTCQGWVAVTSLLLFSCLWCRPSGEGLCQAVLDGVMVMDATAKNYGELGCVTVVFGVKERPNFQWQCHSRYQGDTLSCNMLCY